MMNHDLLVCSSDNFYLSIFAGVEELEGMGDWIKRNFHNRRYYTLHKVQACPHARKSQTCVKH